MAFKNNLCVASLATLCMISPLAFLAAPYPAYAQIANKTGNVAGTAGSACVSATTDYAWPDTNGNTLKCVSNVWTIVTQPASAGGSTGQVQYNSSGALAGSSNFVWDNTDGRVGIGTTSPTSPLTVIGTASFGANIIQATASLPASYGTQDILLKQGTLITGTYTANNGYTSSLQMMDSGANTDLYVNYGIGSFNIFNGGSATATASFNYNKQLLMYGGNTVGTNAGDIWIPYGAALGAAAAGGWGRIIPFDSSTTGTSIKNAWGTGYIGFYTSGGTNGSSVEQMRITASGNVGIGTTSPNAKLDVNSNSIIIEQSNTPADNATCTAGTLWWDVHYIYVCTASGTVKRATLSAF